MTLLSRISRNPPGHREGQRVAAAVLQAYLAGLEHGEQRGVTRQQAELALGAGRDNHVGLAFEDGALGGHDLDLQLRHVIVLPRRGRSGPFS